MLYQIPTLLVLHVLCMKPNQNRKNVLSDIFFFSVLSEHVHSSLNLTTTPHYVLKGGGLLSVSRPIMTIFGL